MNKIPLYALNCNQFVSVVQQICQVLQRERERERESDFEIHVNISPKEGGGNEKWVQLLNFL